MAGVAGWGSRKTLEELQARARQMYGPFRDETRTDPLTGLSYQFSDIRPGQDRTDPVWLTPEQNEATRAYFTDGGRIGDDGVSQKDVTKPAFTQSPDGSYSSGSTTQTVTAPNVGTAWGYTGKPGVFTKTWGALTGDDFPDQVRAKTPWSEAAFNSVDPFLPWSEEEGARIPPALSSLVTEPARLAEKGIKGQEFSPADNAILGMTLFAAGGVGKGLASGKQGGVLGRAGSKLGLEDPMITSPDASVPSLMQNYRDAQSPMFAAGDERSAFAVGAATPDAPTIRAYHGAPMPVEGKFDPARATAGPRSHPRPYFADDPAEASGYALDRNQTLRSDAARETTAPNVMPVDIAMSNPFNADVIRNFKEGGYDYNPIDPAEYKRLVGVEPDNSVNQATGGDALRQMLLQEQQKMVPKALRKYAGAQYGTPEYKMYNDEMGKTYEPGPMRKAWEKVYKRLEKAGYDGIRERDVISDYSDQRSYNKYIPLKKGSVRSATTGEELFAAGDERSAFALGGLTNDQRPFYGRDVGPKGRIGDVKAETARLGLQSGLPEYPTGAGFFNPATAALLQQGVQPRQTVAYYQKQMGARGGKLPPGQWEDITQGLRPDQTIDRDWLVKEIDTRAPAFDTQRYVEDYDGSPGQAGTPEYQNYATKGPFDNYSETVLGYPTPKSNRPTANWDDRGEPKPSDVGTFTDDHFDHPNMEGWYRTQDANQGSTRIAEELQPQRYQKMRDVGEADPAALARTQADLKLLEDQIPRVQQDIRATIQKEAPNFAQHFDEAFYFRGIADSFHDRNVLKGAAGILGENHPKVQAFKYALDQRSHLLGVEKAAQKGVNPSPYTHDINASTDLLLKHMTGKAARDDVDRLAWTPGETQAERYNQALQKVKGLRYEPTRGMLYVKQDGQSHWTSIKSGVPREELGDYVGADVAKKLLATEAKPDMPGANYSGHMLEFPQGMTLGGEGMKGFYGSGPYGEGGIFTARVKALWKKLTGQEPEVKPQTLSVNRNQSQYRGQNGMTMTEQYPSVDLTPEMRDTIRRVGLSMYSSGDEKAAAFLAQFDREGQGLLFGDGASTKPAYEARQLDANGLYSVLDESLPKINRKQANAQAWLNELKKLGVKDQEIYWRGLDDFLKSKGANGQFSKDEIAAYLGNNRVKVWDQLHDQDGTTAEQLRESELENLSERFSYDFDPADWGYTVEEYAPSDAEIAKFIKKRYKIEKTEQNDLFADDTQAPEGAWVILDEGEVREYADSREDAERAAREFAKEDLIKQAEEDGENWVLYDKDGEEYNRYASEDDAIDGARELAVDAEADRIRDMSDKEIWDKFGDDQNAGVMAEHYMEGGRPKGGDTYTEAVLGVGPKTLARKGSKGWTDGTGLSRDSAHPDSPYDHALGWRLQEEYRDLMNPKQKGLLAHELQSRWHARGTERGWRSGGNDEARIAELQRAVKEAEAAHAASDNDYWVNWSAPTGGMQIIKWDQGALERAGRAAYEMESGARALNREMSETRREIERANASIAENAPRMTDATLNEGLRENAGYYVKNAQARLEKQQDALQRAQEKWDREVKPYIEREIADEQALPEGTPRTPEYEAYRAWADRQNDLSLAASEARSRLTSANEGAHPGPWVAGEKSDIMGLLLKTGLYQAAKDNHDFFGVQGAKRMMERWGNSGPHEDYGRIDPKTGREAGVIPMTLQKLARMHKKDAKVEPLYPGNRKVSKGFLEDGFLHRSNQDGQPPLPLDLPPNRMSNKLSTTSKIDSVELTRDDLGAPVYVLKTKRPGYTTPSYLADNGSEFPLTKRDYRTGKDTFEPRLLQFRTREAAEQAMQQINKSKAENYREINNPDALKAAFEETDPVGEPFNAVRFDDDLRESILKRGFPMFAAGDERAALMAGAFANQESLTPASRKAIKRGSSVPDDEKLVVQHNLDQDNLAFTQRHFGGKLPVPSIGIAKASAPLDGFGDVSLIGEPSLVKPARNNPVYTADAFTKRFPDIKLKFDKEGGRILRKRVAMELGSDMSDSQYYAMMDAVKDGRPSDSEALGRAYLKSKGETIPDTDYAIRDKVYRDGGFKDWVDETVGDLAERKLDLGWNDRTMRNTYKPFTLENAVRAMRGGAGDESSILGHGDKRARFAPRLSSLEDIQAERGRIMTRDEWRPQTDAANKQLLDLVQELMPYARYKDRNPFTDLDRKAEAVFEAMTRPHKWKEEMNYQFDAESLPEDLPERFKELRRAYANIGTDYFEAKPQRAVGIDEFKAALVPDDVTGKTMDTLKRHGIEHIEGYDGSQEGRAAALRRFKGLMFSEGEPGAAFAPAPEEEKSSNAEGLASRLMKLWDRK